MNKIPACCKCGEMEATLTLKTHCHPHGGLAVDYYPKLNSIKVTCSICGQFVTQLKLAETKVVPPEVQA